MKTIRYPLLATILASACVSGPTTAQVLNSSFESGTLGDATDWNEIEVVGGALGAAALSERNTADPNTGSYAMFFEVVGAADFGPVAEIQQQTAVGSISPGTNYDFSFASKGVAGPGTVGFYEVSWFDGDGSSGGGPQGSATGLLNYSLGGAYAVNQNLGLLAPATADSVFISIRLVTGAFDGASGEAYIDDVSFTPVPEPAAVAALSGLGALALALFARRRRGTA